MDSDVLDCSICLTRFTGKIYLCESGHSFCENCSRMMRMCPKCGKPMTSNRSYDMEALIQELNKKVKVECRNKGCSYKLTMDGQIEHETECKYRTHICPGAMFCKWNCNWIGTYDDLMKHYKGQHPNNCRLSAVTKRMLMVPVLENYKDVQLLPFLDGKQIFYMKHKADKAAGLVYWAFQFVGPAKEAHNYTYEFEINKDHNKYKINGVCTADTENCEQLMLEQNCVCLTFKQLKHYLNQDGEIDVRFRISTINYIPTNNAHEKSTTSINRATDKKRIIYNKKSP